MPAHGPWIQPDDRFGPAVRTGRGVRARKFDQPATTGGPYETDPDAMPLLSVDIDFPDAQLQHKKGPTFPDASGSQAVIEINPSSDAVATMPPVPPASLPAGAVDYEYEATHGDLVGDIRITGDYGVQVNSTPDSPTDAEWLAQLADTTLELRRVPAAALALGGDGRFHAAGDWIGKATWGGYTLLWQIASPTAEGFTAGTVATITLDASSLDDGKAFVLAAAGIAGQVNFTGHFSGSGGLDGDQNVSISWQPDFGRGLRMSAFYRPPRYRFLYARLPRLRQVPRDDSLGGAPRQGPRNDSRARQSSARQGPRGTYR